MFSFLVEYSEDKVIIVADTFENLQRAIQRRFKIHSIALQVYNKDWESYVNIENKSLPEDKSKIMVLHKNNYQDLR